MIVITGAAGFIGSGLVAYFNEKKIMDAVLVDNFETPFRYRNLAWKYYSQTVEREEMKQFLIDNVQDIDAVIHLGAKSGYMHDNWIQQKVDFMETHQWLWNFCAKNFKPFIFASSGAVYGDGTKGFKDDIETSLSLSPGHPYAQMKLEADNWSLVQEIQPPFWAALRMANVYGPNEYHKMSNASIIYKGYNEILSYNSMRLFASDRPEYEHGGMQRDFIYVKDVVKMISFLLESRPESGIYNIGSGEAKSFKQVTDIIFDELMISPRYEFEPVAESLREAFPYRVELDIYKLRNAGYNAAIAGIDKGVRDYLEKYLMKGEFY